MARLQWALTCKDTSVDSSTNNITYRDAVEQLRISDFPADIPPLMVVAVLWRREDVETPERLEYRIRLENENGETAGWTDPQKVDLEDYERFRGAIKNPPMTIEEPGTIWFVIEENEDGDWEEAWRLPVEIKRLEQDPDAPPATQEVETAENN
jgi:hypothetical protein